MREIKFRCFDKLNNEMCYSGFSMGIDGSFWQYAEQGYLAEDEFILMQYTGLKDRNGVEIYDGDIVFWKDGSENPNHWRYAKVEYYSPRATFCFTIVKCGTLEIGYQFGAEHSFGGYDEIEVIGNVHEHSELIK